jgi:serine/threonine-protein kinase
MGCLLVTDDFTTRLQDALGAAYTLEGELGGGGMSRVYLARQTALGREVVLKVLPPELTSSVNLERFRREIQYAAQLQHPHIVPLLTAGESGELLWYTMPRIPGESLRAVLERRGALPAEEVVQILRDVADALGTAHSRGLVHRDIKPENILLQGEHALVTDFGVAKAISAALPGSGATAVGVAIGTPAYMAPEQVAGDPAADHRIDLYALGLLAYELLTGSTPFRGTSPHQTMAAHLIRQPTPPDAMRAGLPAGLSALVMRCLQKDPDERYPDAAALIRDLRQDS